MRQHRALIFVTTLTSGFTFGLGACSMQPKGKAIQTRSCGEGSDRACGANTRVSGNTVITRDGVQPAEEDTSGDAKKKNEGDLILDDEKILEGLGGKTSEEPEMTEDDFVKENPGTVTDEDGGSDTTAPVIPPAWLLKDYSYEDVIKPLLEKADAGSGKSCVSCHDGSDANRSRLNTYETARANAELAYSLIEGGSMPKGGAPWSDLDKIRLFAWKSRGFPLNKDSKPPTDTTPPSNGTPKPTFRMVWTGASFEMQVNFDTLTGVSNAKYEYFKDSYKMSGRFDRATNQFVMDRLKVTFGFTFHLNNVKYCAARVELQGPNGPDVTPKVDCSKNVNDVVGEGD